MTLDDALRVHLLESYTVPSTVKTHITEHNSARNDVTSSIARHFHEVSHPVSTLSCCVIHQISKIRRSGNADQRLLRSECKWVFYMKTLHPEGLNEELSLSCFL